MMMTQGNPKQVRVQKKPVTLCLAFFALLCFLVGIIRSATEMVEHPPTFNNYPLTDPTSQPTLDGLRRLIQFLSRGSPSLNVLQESQCPLEIARQLTLVPCLDINLGRYSLETIGHEPIDFMNIPLQKMHLHNSLVRRVIPGRWLADNKLDPLLSNICNLNVHTVVVSDISKLELSLNDLPRQ
ncbi:hypothetical protein NEDG_02271, partial [Nematocida displodere]